MAHTPGPWIEPRLYPGKIKDHVASIVVYGNKGRCRVHDYRPLNGNSKAGEVEEHLANAHLIAAAPDLYSAAYQALACLETLGRAADVRAILAKAIAKAEGKPYP